MRGEHIVSGLPGDASTGQSHLACLRFAAIFFLTDAVGRKGVRRDDVGTGLDVFFVNATNGIWDCQTKHVVVAY